MNKPIWELFDEALRPTKRKPKTDLKGVFKMRYRLYLDRAMLFVDCDSEKRCIHRVEFEGEYPLLVADTRHRSATLWMLTEDLTSEWGFDATDYIHDKQNGESHTWKWIDENDNVMLRVVIFSPKDCAKEEVGQVVIAVGEGEDEATRSLFTFMTDFAGWTFIESYGDAEDALTRLGFQLTQKKEEEVCASANDFAAEQAGMNEKQK
jgi:hypothetical protein